MALLTEAQRTEVHASYMQDISARRDLHAGLTSADLRAAIDAADAYIDTNAAAYNLTLPVAARTNLTAAQKALLLSAVALKRYGVI